MSTSLYTKWRITTNWNAAKKKKKKLTVNEYKSIYYGSIVFHSAFSYNFFKTDNDLATKTVSENAWKQGFQIS